MRLPEAAHAHQARPSTGPCTGRPGRAGRQGRARCRHCARCGYATSSCATATASARLSTTGTPADSKLVLLCDPPV